jgi:uncharacterized protein (TIGR02284 family)
MNDLATARILANLYKIVEAGEKGYAVASSNVSNRALKILFSTYAKQRLRFKNEIFAEMQRLGGDLKPKSSILGVIHRGRIDIFAALTIGADNVEKTVLKEVVLGEGVALRAYQKTLKKDLPSETRVLVEGQFQEVRKVVDQIRLMRGMGGKRLLPRLYDSKPDAEKASQALIESGFSADEVRMNDFSNITDDDLYNNGRGTTIFETILSGAAGGATLATVPAILVVINVLRIAASNPAWMAPFLPLVAFLGVIAGGIFVGSVIGLFIGWGISSADKYVSETVKRGEILLLAMVDEPRASRAWKIMYQSAMVARARQARNALA